MKKPLSFLSTWRQHNIFLLGGAILSLILVFQLSISRTIGLSKQYRQNVERVSQAATAPQQITNLQNELEQIQRTAQQVYNREQLLASITQFCKQHQLLVTTFPAAQQLLQNDYPVVTNEVEVEGRYHDIVQLVYLLEQEQRLTSIASLQFYRFKDRTRKKDYLRAKIVMRNRS